MNLVEVHQGGIGIPDRDENLYLHFGSNDTLAGITNDILKMFANFLMDVSQPYQPLILANEFSILVY